MTASMNSRRMTAQILCIAILHGGRGGGLGPDLGDEDGLERRLHDLEAHVQIIGRPANLVFATLDADGKRSQPFRTLFLQGLIDGGVLGPSFVVSAAHSENDIERTGEVVEAALRVYRSALEDGIDRHLRGRSVQPVMRPRA